MTVGSHSSSKPSDPNGEFTSGSPKVSGLREFSAAGLLIFGGLLILTLILSIRLYARYLPGSRGQWVVLMHDRNAHLLQSMVLALDLRYLDLVNFISDLNRARVYPPLFGMLAAPFLAVGGFDYHLAALVSLAGWIVTVYLVFLLTRELAPANRCTAALLAALFALRSPAHQAYATDIMLESVGACLTLFALYLYILSHNKRSGASNFTWLACGLTALFFLKYNYWCLTVINILLWEAISRYGELRSSLQRLWVLGDLRVLLLRELRHPIGWVLVGIVGIASILLLSGGWQFSWAGQPVRVKASLNLAYAFFLILWVRVALVSWRHREHIRPLVGDRGVRLIWCHILPISAWLLWPQKLQYFLRLLLGPSGSTKAQRAAYWSWETLSFYPRALVREYHDNAWTALAAISLALLAFVQMSRLSAHARLLLLFLSATAILTTLHPNHQSRYLHTWAPLLWVAGAVGLAVTLGYGPRPGFVRTAVSSGIMWGLIIAVAISPLASAFTREGSAVHRSEVATALDLSDYYLPRIGCYAHISIFSTVPLSQFAWWTYLQRYPSQRSHLTVGLKRFGDSVLLNQAQFAEWLRQTSSQAIVFIDIPPGSFFYWPGEENHQQYRSLVQSQEMFREVGRRVFPQYGSTVSILARGEGGKHPVQCGYGQRSGGG